VHSPHETRPDQRRAFAGFDIRNWAAGLTCAAHPAKKASAIAVTSADFIKGAVIGVSQGMVFFNTLLLSSSSGGGGGRMAGPWSEVMAAKVELQGNGAKQIKMEPTNRKTV
jgi:hypothetical protein